MRSHRGPQISGMGAAVDRWQFQREKGDPEQRSVWAVHTEGEAAEGINGTAPGAQEEMEQEVTVAFRCCWKKGRREGRQAARGDEGKSRPESALERPWVSGIRWSSGAGVVRSLLV